MAETLNPFLNAQKQVKNACDKLGLEPDVYELLKEPQRMIEISIPVRMDDGSLRIFKGYRSAHNAAVGPCKGGVRFHQDVNPDEVKALSIWMTFKGGVLGLPYGGGKGGVTCNPRELSAKELEQISRGWVRGLHKYLGEKIDIPAPDVNTNGQIMSWMVDEYVKLNGEEMSIGVITGKPVAFGGSLGRNEATGFGVSIIVRESAKKFGIDMKGAKVAVQGFGNVGKYTVKNIQKQGAKVVALAEFDFVTTMQPYAIYNEDGLDFADMATYADAHKVLCDYPKAKKITMDEFWALQTDVFVPAAMENVLTAETVAKLNCKLVCEAANGPTTPEGDVALRERNIALVPDILTNSGGVLVSYFEWVQNRYGYYWTEKEVEERQEQSMVQAFNAMWEVKEQYDVTPREATYMYAIKQIAEAMKLRGWY